MGRAPLNYEDGLGPWLSTHSSTCFELSEDIVSPELCIYQEMSRSSIFTSREPEGQFKRVTSYLWEPFSHLGQMGEKEEFGIVPTLS